jgi:hypothetical protein
MNARRGWDAATPREGPGPNNLDERTATPLADWEDEG